MSKIPIELYAEMTPNPATMKFVANKVLIEGGQIAEYQSAVEAKGSSTLAEQLFNLPFVQSIFISGNFVTVTKTSAVGWEAVMQETREFIKSFLEENEVVVQKVPEIDDKTEVVIPDLTGDKEPESEIEEKIVAILNEYVRPAVENDGGAINFKSYSEGTVNVVLRGSCSGCPSAAVTLKQGIEALLKNMLPEINEVVAEEL